MVMKRNLFFHKINIGENKKFIVNFKTIANA